MINCETDENTVKTNPEKALLKNQIFLTLRFYIKTSNFLNVLSY